MEEEAAYRFYCLYVFASHVKCASIQCIIFEIPKSKNQVILFPFVHGTFNLNPFIYLRHSDTMCNKIQCQGLLVLGYIHIDVVVAV